MKSPLVATLLWLALCLSAQAQPQCPQTPAQGTSNSMCASTAFVARGNPGTPSNILNSQTANYSVAKTDCGKTIQAGTGSTGQFTITLPAVTGFAKNCVVTVYNADTTRGKGLSGFPAPTSGILWPLQTTTVSIVNGAWATTGFQARWKVPSSITMFVDPVNGSASNDCLAAGAGGACAAFITAINRAEGQMDFNNETLTIQFASGQSYSNLSIQAGLIGLLSGLIVDGGGSTFTSATSAEAVQVNTSWPQLITLQNMVITNTSTGDGLYVHSGNIVTGPGMVFGAAGRFQIHTQQNTLLNMASPYTINGNAQAHIFTESVSTYNLDPVAITLSGTPAFSTAYAQATTNSVQAYFGTFSGSATGKRYLASSDGVIATNGAGATYLPGNAAGSVSAGGNYDSPGTPSVSSCGTTPGAPAGTDMSGNVVEGATAIGCTVAFTTANTPKSCSVNSSSSTVQAGLVVTSLSATQLVVTHPSASGATLYWNCPAP